jgi:hypothetical protein
VPARFRSGPSPAACAWTKPSGRSRLSAC